MSLLTETMVAKDREERERLGPIAQMVGISLEEAAQDRELRAALVCIAERREERGLARAVAPRSGESSTTRSATEPSAPSAPPTNLDVGDQAVEQLLAQREGREPAAWATRPLPAPTAGGARQAATHGPQTAQALEQYERFNALRVSLARGA